MRHEIPRILHLTKDKEEADDGTKEYNAIFGKQAAYCVQNKKG